MKAYKEALKKANNQLFGLTVTELDDSSFTLEGEYFTLEFQPSVEYVQIHSHEQIDVIVECMMEELAEMTCMQEQLRPFMDEIVKGTQT